MTRHVWLTRGALLAVLGLIVFVVAAGPSAVGQQRRGRTPPQRVEERIDRLIDDLAEQQPDDGEAGRAPLAVNERRPAEARIAQALEEKTEIDFDEQPFNEVIDFLKERHSIEIQIDGKALEDAGLGSDVPINRHLRGITLASTLDLLLGDLELTYLIRDEVLLITSQAAANATPETRVYPVSDLVSGHGAGPDELEERYELLVETVIQAIGGKMAVARGSVRAYPPSGAIVVHLPQPDHREMEDVLSQLRRARQWQEGRERR